MVGQPVMFDATVGTVLPGLESLHLYLVVTSLKWSWGCVICSGILACAIHNLIIQWKSGALVLLYGTAEQKTPYVISGNHVSYCDNVALVRKMFSCFPSIFFSSISRLKPTLKHKQKWPIYEIGLTIFEVFLIFQVITGLHKGWCAVEGGDVRGQDVL